MIPDPLTSFSVANINPGTVRTEFMTSIMALVEKERALQHEVDSLVPRVRFDKYYSHLSGPYLDDARNNCALWFLADEAQSEWLLYIDSDIEFTPDQPFELIRTAHESGVTILTGVYYSDFYQHGGIRALVHEWGEHPITKLRDLIPLAPIHLAGLYPQNKPHPMDACGFGFVAVHRSVFLDMSDHYGLPQPFFAELCIDEVHMGEDLTFCIRSAAIDHRPYVLPSVAVVHHKHCALRPG